MSHFRYFIISIFIVAGHLFCTQIYAQDKSQDISGLIDSAGNMMRQNKADRSIFLASNILKKNLTDVQKAKVFKILAQSYGQKNKIDKTISYALESKKYAEESGDDESMADVYNLLGDIYLRVYLYEKSEYYLKKSIHHLNILSEMNKPNYLLSQMSYLNLGNLSFDKKNFGEAERYYISALHSLDNLPSSNPNIAYLRKVNLYSLGDTYLNLNKIDLAESYLNKSFQIKGEEINNKSLDVFIGNSLAKVYSKRGFYRKAVDSLEVILAKGDIENLELRSMVYRNIADNYDEIGEHDKFRDFNEKYNVLKDSVQKINAVTINSSIDASEKTNNDVVSNSRNKNQLLFKIIIAIVFIFSILLTIQFYIKRREKKIFQKIVSDLREKLEYREIDVFEEKTIDNSALINESMIIPHTSNFTKQSIVPSDIEKELIKKLEQFEKTEKFTDSKITISSLAVQFKTNNSYLSDVINKYKGKNFNTYINELRINYICEKILTQPEYRNYKISFLAEDSGFTSHSVFSAVFKTVTGISPSVFIRESTQHSTLD